MVWLWGEKEAGMDCWRWCTTWPWWCPGWLSITVKLKGLLSLTPICCRLFMEAAALTDSSYGGGWATPSSGK